MTAARALRGTRTVELADPDAQGRVASRTTDANAARWPRKTHVLPLRTCVRMTTVPPAAPRRLGDAVTERTFGAACSAACAAPALQPNASAKTTTPPQRRRPGN